MTSTPETATTTAKATMDAARKASFRLRKSSLNVRIEALPKLIDHILRHKERIIDDLCAETGKSRSDALISEILGILDNFAWLHKNARKILADKRVSTPLMLLGKKSRIVHEAHGVVLVITPWNYPLHIALTSVLAAYVAGNTVILKPSEYTPLKAVLEALFAVDPLLEQSIFVVQGAAAEARALIDQRPDKIFFTGSARTGQHILRQAAEYLIPVDLELGGKDQSIVFADANLQRAVAGVLWGALTNAGQSCSSVERIYVQRPAYEAFVEQLAQEAAVLVVNSGDQGDADIGGITTSFQLDIIERHVEDARAKGATIHCGGQRIAAQGNHYLPTVISAVTPDMQLMQEETFGPLLPVIVFDDEDEVITTSNATGFGLSASVWSADKKRAERVARALECGAVSINNVMLTEGNPALPFGGCKGSGYGRQKGTEGLLGYTRSKSLLIDADSAKIEANWYPYTHAKYALFTRLIDSLFTSSPWRLIKFALAGLKLESEAQKKRG